MRAFEQAQLTIRSLLARALAATTVARLARLSAASEVWGGATPLDRPAWYLWLEQAAGAYRLELEDATPLAVHGEHGPSSSPPPEQGWHARLSIRYYPSPRERSFPTFSAEEREVVLGGSLDRTGAPRIEVAATIPPHLFVVGSLEWAESSDRLGAVLALAALDRVRVAAASDGGPGADDPVPAPPLDRDVPGWALATPLLTSIAAIHAQLHGQVLERAVLARQPGFELVRSADGTYLTRDTDEVTRGDALLGFVVPRAQGASDRMVEALVDPAAVVVADERFGGGCRHPPALEAQPRIPLAVSDAWFGGAVHVEHGLTCSC